MLEQALFNNSLLHWAAAFAVAAGAYTLLVAAKRHIVRRVDAQPQRGGLTLAEAAEALKAHGRDWTRAIATRTSHLFILVVALFAGTYVLDLPQGFVAFVRSALVVALFLQMAIWVSKILAASLERYAARTAPIDETVDNALSLVQLFARLAVWTVTLLLILGNLGFDVSTLIAGLGIGGIAVALAAQNILSDLFASLSIVLSGHQSDALPHSPGRGDRAGIVGSGIRSDTSERRSRNSGARLGPTRGGCARVDSLGAEPGPRACFEVSPP